MASFQRFLGAYTAYVSERPPFSDVDAPAVEYWRPFVDSLPDRAVEHLCRAVRAEWRVRGGGKPTLADFKAVWARIGARRADSAPVEPCAACAGSGRLRFVGTYLGGAGDGPSYAVGVGERPWAAHDQGAVGMPSWVVTYCACASGRRLAGRDNGAPPVSYSEQARDWLIGARRAAERDGVSLAEYGDRLIEAARDVLQQERRRHAPAVDS